MKQVTFTITGISNYSQSKNMSPKKERETHKDHEERAWRERLHVNSDGNVFIPPMSIKNVLSEAAKFLAIQIPGKGKSTYTKHFEAGILVVDPSVILDAKGKPISAKDVAGEWLFVPADGKRGGSKRVEKCFPYVPAGWQANVSLIVMDPLVTPDVFKLHLERAGQFIGLGRFRPRNNGYYGRFTASNIKWQAVADDIGMAA